jgi:hypothetical protein
MDEELRLQPTEEDADAEQLDELAGSLRQELLQLDVADVTKLLAGEPPPGAQATDTATAGGLLVAVGSAAHGLSAVIAATRAWLARGGTHRGRAVRLELGGDTLELSQASAADQEQLIGLFIRRHATGEGLRGLGGDQGGD